MTFHDDELGSELQPIADRLRAERPTLSAMELDVVKQRARAAATRPTTPKRGFMRSRLAILLMLVLGLTFSTTGAGLAISGFADGGGQAAATQYDNGDDGGGVLPDSDNGDDNGGGGNAADETDEADVQPARQFESTQGGSLPFTGFAAIPVLVLGLGLLSAGLIVRRTNRDDA
jgi:hypothetical protein